MSSCALDRVTPAEAEAWARGVLERSGLAAAVKDLRRADVRALVGNPAACAAVRVNRVVSVAHILVVGASAAATAAMMRGGSWRPPVWLGVLGAALTAFRQRHALLLLGKLAWHGFTPATRRLLLASVAVSSVVVGAGVAVDFYRARLSPRVLALLLGVVLAASLVKMLVLWRGLVNPEAAYLAAVTAAASRVANGQNIARLKASFAG